MADITTGLNRAPYFDDFNENKKFYRILFKPGTAVQARELSQIQSMLQKQISRFGSHVFKEGSIVDGVNPSVIGQSHVVRVKNSFSNNSAVSIDDITGHSNNLFVVSQTSGLRAKLHTALDGSEAASPETKRLYVSYQGVDDTQTRTSVGTISVSAGSNTITGSGTSFTNYSVGDQIAVFETNSELRSSYNAKINSIANNISMETSRAFGFSNTSIGANNYVIKQNIDLYGILGTSDSPEVLDLVEISVRNSQSNTVNTSLTSNTFNLDFTPADATKIAVFVNNEEKRTSIDFTANTTAVKMKADLKNGDQFSAIERLETTRFTGLQAFKTASVSTSEKSVVVKNDEGVVYHKGKFLNIDPGFTVVADKEIDANNSVVVISSDETLVSYRTDTSLLDNAAGFANQKAPGADRLKIDPKISSANATSLADKEAVAVMINFSEAGKVLSENREPQYNILEDKLAKRDADALGSFTIKRFVTDTESVSSNNELIKITTEPGEAYVDGYHVEIKNTATRVIERGINTAQRDDFEMGISYGNYVRVTEYDGNFAPYDRLNFVHTSNDGYTPASNTTFLTSMTGTTPAGSTTVGTAFVKNVELESGTPGAPDAIYRVFLFGVDVSSSQNLQDARAITVNDTLKGAADIVLDSSNNAVITDIANPHLSTFGESFVRSYTDDSDVYDNNFVVRKFASVTDSMNTDGTITIDLDDETDLTGNNKIGTYIPSEVNQIILTNEGSEISCSASGTTTASANVVTVATGLTANIHVGDIVQIDSSNKTIVTKILSTTQFQTKDDLTDTSGTLKKIIPQHKVIAVDSDMVTTNQTNNTLDITIPTLNDGNWSGSTTVRASYEFNGNDYKPFDKNINKDTYRRINTANNSANSVGPWDLGVVDIHKVTGVWVLTNKNDGNANDTFTDADLTASANKVNGGFFEFDSGQRDAFYDHGKLHLTNKGRVKNFVSSNSTIVVAFDYFSVDDTDGEGYFTVDSYPTTTEASANSTTIKFEEIPTYIAQNGDKFSLRDYVDHRPRLLNISASELTNDANASSVDVVNAKGSTQANDSAAKNSFLVFKNNSEFVSDYKINLPKVADVYVGEVGSYEVSVANTGSTPAPIDKAMKVASLTIPPFPSLSREEDTTAKNTYSGGKLRDKRTQFGTTGGKVSIDQFFIRRYTMSDIGRLDKRITNLEYYVTLSSLESLAANKQIQNSDGVDRFKNGIFVEPFVSHQFGATTHDEYKVSIDVGNGGLFRPTIEERLVENFTPEIVSGSDKVEISGNRINFKFTETDYAKQDKATKTRPAAPVEFRFAGTLNLFPEYDVGTDSTNVGRIIVDEEDIPNVQEGTVTTFGRWRTTSSNSRQLFDGRGPAFARSITTRNQTRVRETITTTVNEGFESFGQAISDISVTPYIRELAIGFHAQGLRPNSLHSFFFDGKNMDSNVHPAELLRSSPSGIPTLDPAAEFTEEQEFDKAIATSGSMSDQAMTLFRRFRKGDPLKSNEDGSVSGVFIVPADTFLQGERVAMVADVEDLEVEKDSIISSAESTFYSNRLGVQSAEFGRKTFDVEVTTSRRTRSRTTTTVTVDPIAQTFYVRDDNEGDQGIFVSSIDLFFKNKSDKNGIRVFITDVENGYPDTSRIYKATDIRKKPAFVNVSDDASTATNFKFKYPVFLRKGRSYAFVVKPDASDPDYDVYFAKLGGTDLTTGTAVNSQPYEGVAFMGANLDTWSAIQDEDIKFTLKRAEFETGTATVRMKPRNVDTGEYEDITYINSETEVRVGDLVYGMTSANTDPDLTVANVNTSIFGTVSEIDTINQKMKLAPTTGNWTTSSTKVFTDTLLDGSTVDTTKYKLAFYRPTDTQLDTDNLNLDRFVGSTFMSLEDFEFSTVVPQYTTGVFDKSSIDANFVYNISNTASKTIDSTLDGEFEHTEAPFVLRSRTNEKNKLGSATAGTSFYLDLNLENQSTSTTPFVDLRRTLLTAIGNKTITHDENANNFIDGTSVATDTSASIFSEMFDGLGESNARYITKPIELADGQDAEDIRVFVNAFKPPRGEIYVYGRFVNQNDNIDDVLFTPLKNLNPDQDSDRTDRSDLKEYEFRFHTHAEMDDTQYVNIFDDTTASDYAFKHTEKFTSDSLITANTTTGIAEYTRNGSKFSTFKTFQLKVVTYAQVDSPDGYGTKNSANPVLVESIRAIALQV